MDFGALAPEINSARMYMGPGSAPMVAAASAWNGLAAELRSAATGYETILTRLVSEEWMGPASGAMSEAVTPYVQWMSTTAVQAEHAATQARSAAAAYEAAHAMTVPPAAIDANRLQLQSLVSTNVLGQNTPAIAATDAHYGEMWAQDAAAMYGYAGHSAAATQVTPFAAPHQTTNPAGLAGQTAAVAQAVGTSTSSHAQTAQLLATLPNALQQMAQPLQSTSSSSASGLGQLLSGVSGGSSGSAASGGLLGAWAKYIGPLYNTMGLGYFGAGIPNHLQSAINGITGAMSKTTKAVGDGAAAAAGAAGSSGLGGLLGGGAPVSAGLGDAAMAGRLAVPPAWPGAGEALAPLTKPVPISTVAPAVTDGGGAGNLMGGMPLAGAHGGAAAGAGPKYGFRPTVMARPPFAG